MKQLPTTEDLCGLCRSMPIPLCVPQQMGVDKRHNNSHLGAGSTREHQKVTRQFFAIEIRVHFLLLPINIFFCPRWVLNPLTYPDLLVPVRHLPVPFH
jgi:hypothetical protein